MREAILIFVIGFLCAAVVLGTFVAIGHLWGFGAVVFVAICTLVGMVFVMTLLMWRQEQKDLRGKSR